MERRLRKKLNLRLGGGTGLVDLLDDDTRLLVVVLLAGVSSPKGVVVVAVLLLLLLCAAKVVGEVGTLQDWLIRAVSSLSSLMAAAVGSFFLLSLLLMTPPEGEGRLLRLRMRR